MQLEPVRQTDAPLPPAASAPALSWVQRNRMIMDLIASEFCWQPDDLMRVVASIAIGKSLYTDDFLESLWNKIPDQYKTVEPEAQ